MSISKQTKAYRDMLGDIEELTLIQNAGKGKSGSIKSAILHKEDIENCMALLHNEIVKNRDGEPLSNYIKDKDLDSDIPDLDFIETDENKKEASSFDAYINKLVIKHTYL